MKIEWKKTKALIPHCPECKQILGGNNSILMPYNCECGQWEYDFKNNEYKLILN